MRVCPPQRDLFKAGQIRVVPSSKPSNGCHLTQSKSKDLPCMTYKPVRICVSLITSLTSLSTTPSLTCSAPWCFSEHPSTCGPQPRLLKCHLKNRPKQIGPFLKTEKQKNLCNDVSPSLSQLPTSLSPQALKSGWHVMLPHVCNPGPSSVPGEQTLQTKLVD